MINKMLMTGMFITVCISLSIIGILVSPSAASATNAPLSTFFATAYEEDGGTYDSPSNGDLWPAAWSNDDYLYAANGDGRGFTTSLNFSDIDISRVSGSPATENMTGTTLAQGNAIGKIWGSTSTYNRKPTGMVSVDGNLYMAIQDLNLNFRDAPNASISKSTDKGVTWTFNTSAPMFDNHIFTTIMFLDYGKDSQYAIDNYVYAYGLDYNWRTSGTYPDPTKLFLARVPKTSIQNRSTWEFYTGGLNGGTPSWSSDINLKTPVLQDDRRAYAVLNSGASAANNMTVVSQGSIVYNQPLNRYIYSSWTEYTHEYYESPNPWGPWKLFLTKDFGPDQLSWTVKRNGGYTTVIPSKFISADGKTMYVQSNCFGGDNTVNIQHYDMAFRKLIVEPYVSTTPTNTKTGDNLALPQNGDGVTRLNKSFHFGDTGMMNDGNLAENQDSWDKEAKTSDWWGYTWKKAYNLNRVVYTTGNMFSDGGWFSTIKVQVRQNNVWVDVSGLQTEYPTSNAAGTNKTYNFIFNDTWGDGVRIIGTPGGTAHFTSIAELGATYINNNNLVQDPGFESQTTNTISSPWAVDGADPKGVDRGLGLAHSGANNAWINTGGTNWNAVKQTISVTPNTDYTMTVWLRGTSNIVNGWIGIADASGATFANQKFGSLSAYTKLTLKFNSGSNTSIKPYAGYYAPNVSSWLRIDDISVITEINNGNLIQDPGFEKQKTTTLSSPWIFNGTDAKGIDLGTGLSNSGANNAWITTSNTNWNMLKQTITVTPNKNYRMTVWLKGSSNIVNGWIGITDSAGATFSNQKFGSLANYTMLTLDFNSGSNTTISPYAGYWGPGAASFLKIDDISVVGMNWN
jgi:hypothetical protein